MNSIMQMNSLFPFWDQLEHFVGQMDNPWLNRENPLALSAKEVDNQLVLQFEMPGYAPEEIEIYSIQNVLVIRQKNHFDPNSLPANNQNCEPQFSEHRFKINDDYQIDAIKAKMNNGLLTVRIPHKTVQAPIKINIE